MGERGRREALGYCKYHFKTVQGIENFTDARTNAAEDKDYHLRDLYNSIANGDAPEWRVEMQIMPFKDAADYRLQSLRPDQSLGA